MNRTGSDLKRTVEYLPDDVDVEIVDDDGDKFEISYIAIKADGIVLHLINKTKEELRLEAERWQDPAM